MERHNQTWGAGYSIREHWKEARVHLWDDFERYNIRMSEVNGNIYVHTMTKGMLELEGSEVVRSKARKVIKAQREESTRIAREKVRKRGRVREEDAEEIEFCQNEEDDLMYQSNGHIWRCVEGMCYCPEEDLMHANYEGVVSSEGKVCKLPFIKRTKQEMLLKRPRKMSRKEIDIFYGLKSQEVQNDK